MSLDAEISRKIEKAFVQLLTPNLPLLPVPDAAPGTTAPLRLLPGGGSDETPRPENVSDEEDEDAGELVPPYAVIGVMDVDEFITGSGTYTANARLLLLTLSEVTTPQQHSEWLSTLKQALDAIARPVTIDALNFRLNGFDIMGRWEPVDDPNGQFRCHAIPLAIGANG